MRGNEEAAAGRHEGTAQAAGRAGRDVPNAANRELAGSGSSLGSGSGSGAVAGAQGATARPAAADLPDPRDREAFKAWAEKLAYPDRSNCRA